MQLTKNLTVEIHTSNNKNLPTKILASNIVAAITLPLSIWLFFVAFDIGWRHISWVSLTSTPSSADTFYLISFVLFLMFVIATIMTIVWCARTPLESVKYVNRVRRYIIVFGSILGFSLFVLVSMPVFFLCVIGLSFFCLEMLHIISAVLMIKLSRQN